ncbi:hypothetical protein SCHPADRAFT_1002933 [Schizopora paradoxa]|uniref:Uncharacterized protein n=1 Tax=Schizopora paradoxa TaxID=27342 RepID=A0A0H2R0Y5_9AGAM|nr:hypothetical protein SCHPADRAFT_1002933 [Schizopora paradoxa]
MQQPSDSARLRLAVALVIVKSVPRGCSFAAYIAQLCRQFPLDSDPSNGDSVERWRERALFLEDELRTLKRKSNADAADIALLRASNVDASSAPQNKKKRKTAKEVVSVDRPVSHTTSTPELSSSQAVLQTYERAIHIADLLGREETSATDKSAYTQLFVSTTLDALHTLSGALESAIASRSNNSTLPNIDFILSSLLERALSVQCFDDDIIGTLLSEIFHPSLKLFRTLSLRALEDVVQPEGPESRKDLRPELLLLFKHALQALSRDARELFSAISAYTIHELSSLFVSRASEDRRQRRLERVALDDSVWYLCAVLQGSLPLSSNRDEILESIITIYNSHRAQLTDVVASILMGLIERIW